ncbi:ATP binding protein [Magnetococcus marinus MC-1]|uniref:ATP binding protein n=1 Tax=Magnetococcus marinus (strain ATCC BAA-1437 / JCM 17883 / MC-1) TaxID=156889 RepID=A0L3J0_MAGMM|nr:AAA family ATPase [Magnetococcus marinus]ABK42533.1 ATP binding protein [Magnetococcus marinus MC-1]
MKLNTLTLSNFRCFESLEITFDDYLTVLVAQNGGGKTAILDAIGVALGPYLGAFDEAVGSHFSPEDVRTKPSHTQPSMESLYPLTLVAHGVAEGQEIHWERALKGKKSKTTVAGAKNLVLVAKNQQVRIRQGISVDLPLLAYYGTGRLWRNIRVTTSTKQGWGSRTLGYTNALSPASSFNSFERWFQDTDRAHYDYQLEHSDGPTNYGGANAFLASPERDNPFGQALDAVRGAVDLALESVQWGTLRYSGTHRRIVVSHPAHGILPVHLLSDGIRNMIGLVADMAYRAVRLNPHLGVEAAQRVEGVVLIDEVDMHLHPAWQQVVLTDLRKAFPKVQFVVTTHSPQVLTTVKRENIRVLEIENGRGTARPPLTQTLGRDNRETIEDVMQVDARPPIEPTTQLKHYLDMVGQGNGDTIEALNLRAILEQIYGKDYTKLRVADCAIHKYRAMRAQSK